MWLSQMLSTVPTLAPSQLPCGVTCVSIRSRMPISMMMPSSSGRLLTCSLVMVWGGGVMPQAYHSTARTWHPKYANHKFKEALALHMAAMKSKGASYLFESSWKRRYSDRGVRKLLARYAAAAGLDQTISPHMLRHYLLTWLKKQGVDDALFQPYSGHASRQSLEIYSRLAIEEAQEEYNTVMQKFPMSSGEVGSTL